MSESDETLRAFSAEHVVKLTGLSKSQLRYWDRTGFFQPDYASENRRSAFSRVYSFQNVAGLRTLGILRRTHKIPLQQLRKVAAELSKYRNAPWSQIKLYVFRRQVAFSEPETGQMREVVSGQYVLVKLESIIHDLKMEASKLKERSPEHVGAVVRNRFIAHNAWVVAGTRIPTRAIQRFHEAGYSAKAIIREYPMLEEADIAAALGHEKKIAKRA